MEKYNLNIHWSKNVSKEYGNKISKTLKKYFKQKRGGLNGME